MAKKALITGIKGQDGAYLAKFLLEKGYDVYGADRRRSDEASWRLNELGIEHDVKTIYMDLLEFTNVIDVVKKLQPDKIFNLAAQSFVKAKNHIRLKFVCLFQTFNTVMGHLYVKAHIC